MRGSSRCESRCRPRLRVPRLALVGAVAATVALAPGVAAAGDEYDSSLVPVLTCVTQAENGTYTAVFGYHNRTSRVISVPRGDNNNVDPSGPVPEVFQPGLHHGAFSVTTTVDRRVEWELYDYDLRAYSSSQPSCGPEVQMPADGNGSGAVIALVGAGVIGAAMVHRSRRGVRTAAPGEPGSGAGDDDA